jgi:hypothetical protein
MATQSAEQLILWRRITRNVGVRRYERAEIEIGGICEEECHNVVIEILVRADCTGEVPAVDRYVKDSHRQQFPSGPIAGRVVPDSLERSVPAKAPDNAVCRPDKRGQRVVAKMINGARRFDLFGRCAVQQQLVANVGADNVID